MRQLAIKYNNNNRYPANIRISFSRIKLLPVMSFYPAATAECTNGRRREKKQLKK
jgi:hypothetical protein